MNEPSSSIAEPSVFHARAVAGFGWSLLSAVAVVVLLNAIDRPRRSQLEHHEQVTAVGDNAFFRLPDTAQAAPAAVAIFRRQELHPVSLKAVEIRDSKMLIAGTDDSGRSRIYTSRDPAPLAEGEVEKKSETAFFLKLGPGKYLKVHATAPGNE
jgi:hypothetical protein